MSVLGTKERLEEALGTVFSALNVLGGGNSEVVQDFFSRQHRTIQQAFVGVVIVPVLQQLAKAHAEGWVDLRNERSAALAAKMLAAVDEDDLYLPLI